MQACSKVWEMNLQHIACLLAGLGESKHAEVHSWEGKQEYTHTRTALGTLSSLWIFISSSTSVICAHTRSLCFPLSQTDSSLSLSLSLLSDTPLSFSFVFLSSLLLIIRQLHPLHFFLTSRLLTFSSIFCPSQHSCFCIYLLISLSISLSCLSAGHYLPFSLLFHAGPLFPPLLSFFKILCHSWTHSMSSTTSLFPLLNLLSAFPLVLPVSSSCHSSIIFSTLTFFSIYFPFPLARSLSCWKTRNL